MPHSLMAETDAVMLYDPLDPEFRKNPYPHYLRLRQAEPVLKMPFGNWVLSRYRDVDALLRDTRVTTEFPESDAWARHRGGLDGPLAANTRRWMLMRDGGMHRRLRGLLGRLFIAGAVRTLRPTVEQYVTELLDSVG